MSRFQSLLIMPATLITLIAVLGTCVADAQQGALVPNRRPAITPDAPSADIRWSLRMRGDAVIQSPLIRLRDIATPVGPSTPGWDRAGGLVVAILPVDTTEMVIDRSRLIETLRAEAMFPPIEWTGPDQVHIRHVRSTSTEDSPQPKTDAPTLLIAPAPLPSMEYVATTGGKSAEIHHVAKASAITERPAVLIDNRNTSGTAITGSDVDAKPVPDLSEIDANRLTRLIQFAIDRADLSLRESYDIDIDVKQEGLRRLAELRRVDRVEFVSSPAEGINAVSVHGMTSRNEVTGQVDLRLTARPLVVTPRESLRRGHVIRRSDLTLIPAPRGIAIDSVLTDMDDAVDMQVQAVLQKHRPIQSSALSRPILVDRGNLVELQVVGGGIMVATSARSLAAGAAGDLIAVETLEPRKKVMARVVRPGLVEIATRPPRVR
jgi:flagellar basal body P-ring formation protein FlgA